MLFRYFSRHPCCPGKAGGQREEGGDRPQHVGQEHVKSYYGPSMIGL